MKKELEKPVDTTRYHYQKSVSYIENTDPAKFQGNGRKNNNEELDLSSEGPAALMIMQMI